jgi:hypothetical protein
LDRDPQCRHRAADLDGWYLTDDADELTKWQFPAVSWAPGEYRVVFASDKDRAHPAGELHTDFKLSGNGDSVALVMPDGTTVAHAYWDFPEQLDDISYGISGLESVFSMPVARGAEGSSYLVRSWSTIGRPRCYVYVYALR